MYGLLIVFRRTPSPSTADSVMSTPEASYLCPKIPSHTYSVKYAAVLSQESDSGDPGSGAGPEAEGMPGRVQADPDVRLRLEKSATTAPQETAYATAASRS